MLSFKPTFSLYTFTFIKGLVSSYSLSALRVVSSAYLRLLIFLLAILIPACVSSSPAFLMIDVRDTSFGMQQEEHSITFEGSLVICLHICVKEAGIHYLTICLSICWRRQWQATPVLLPRKSHGQRSLVGCSPWGRYESDKTEQLHFHALEKEMVTHSSFLPGESQGRRSLVDCRL